MSASRISASRRTLPGIRPYPHPAKPETAMPVNAFRRTLLAILLLPLAAAAAGTRTHVSNAGDDANASFSCDAAHPCRTFAAALAQTTPGGEILAIDSSGYGKVTIDRSVSIIAAPGVFAGIGVGSGNGVTIATAGVNVVLRGLSITGQGGNYGVRMTDGARLAVENCVIANFTGGSYGVYVSAPVQVRIVDSLFRDNQDGVRIQNGAKASIAGSRFFGNWVAVSAIDSIGTTTALTVSNSVASGNAWGFSALESHGGTIALSVIDSVASGNSIGIDAAGASGTIKASVSNSLVAGNGNGMRALGANTRLSAGGNTVTRNTFGFYIDSGGVIQSAGNNTVRNNTTNALGSLTPLSTL